jgi:hypothetical protein
LVALLSESVTGGKTGNHTNVLETLKDPTALEGFLTSQK